MLFLWSFCRGGEREEVGEEVVVREGWLCVGGCVVS